MKSLKVLLLAVLVVLLVGTVALADSESGTVTLAVTVTTSCSGSFNFLGTGVNVVSATGWYWSADLTCTTEANCDFKTTMTVNQFENATGDYMPTTWRSRYWHNNGPWLPVGDWITYDFPETDPALGDPHTRTSTAYTPFALHQGKAILKMDIGVLRSGYSDPYGTYTATMTATTSSDI